MGLIKLKPACKDYLWGGHRLVEEFGVDYDGDILAEAWELSCHPDGPSIIDNGKYKGKSLQEYIDQEGMEVLGTNCRRFREFPILTKFIDARDNLSIQVHPDNAYALKNENQYGKTEMWYVLDAQEDAFLYYGFKEEISKEEFAQRIKDNTLTEVLNAVPVVKGDVLFIESGTLHAIGKGILIAEIQQNSNVTYRIYDYGRKGADGKERDLHIEQALEVTNRTPIRKSGQDYPHVGNCDYFTVDKLNLDGNTMSHAQGSVGTQSFLSILILDGQGTIRCQGEVLPYKKGDSFFLPAGSGDWQIEGVCDALLTTIGEKENPMRIGIIIGSHEIQIGIVNDQQQLIDLEKYKMDPLKQPLEILEDVANRTLALLDKNHITLDQCIGAGVGIPGTIDRKAGKVVYSNNMQWEDVPVAKELGKVILCPVRIANDADCAALGETIAGAGIDVDDLAMFTVGNGVGGGLIINGEVFEGGMIGGSEVGHMSIQSHGRLCTCGRKGCLEAYASIPSLMRDIAEKTGKEMMPKEIFASRDNKQIQEVLDTYTEYLGTGIVNIVNLYRPQLIILGGAISKYAAILVPALEAYTKRYAFGRGHGMVPKITVAQLGNLAGVIGAANL